MTGLNPKKDRILEIGAVRMEDGRITDTFHRMVNPHMKLSKDITDLTGITEEMVLRGVTVRRQYGIFCNLRMDLRWLDIISSSTMHF